MTDRDERDRNRKRERDREAEDETDTYGDIYRRYREKQNKEGQKDRHTYEGTSFRKRHKRETFYFSLQ